MSNYISIHHVRQIQTRERTLEESKVNVKQFIITDADGHRTEISCFFLKD